MAKQIVTVGHDAELFLYDENDNAIPSIGLVGGSKECPRPVNGGAVQEDNVMAELNIEPCTTAKQFVNRTNDVMESLTFIILILHLLFFSFDNPSANNISSKV